MKYRVDIFDASIRNEHDEPKHVFSLEFSKSRKDMTALATSQSFTTDGRNFLKSWGDLHIQIIRK